MKRKINGGLKLGLVFLLIGLALSSLSNVNSSLAWAEDIAFDQNQGGYGGYQAGAYDLNSQQATADNWTRQSRFTAGNNPVLKWDFNTSSSILGSPVIGADGTVYFGAQNGTFYAVDSNGNQKWTYATGYEIVSSPAIGADGTVYATSKDGNLYAFNQNGSLKWMFVSGNMIEASPVIGADGSIYVGCTDGSLFSIDTNGESQWKYATAGITVSLMVGNDGCIYACSRDGFLYCIKPNGTLKWQCKLEANPSSPAIDKEGNIYICAGSSLYVVSSKGNIRFDHKLAQSSEIKSSVALGADGCVYVGADMLYRFTPGSANNWRCDIYNCSALVLGANGTIFAASNYVSGVLYAVNREGTKIWQYPVSSVEGAPAIGRDGSIFVCSRDGKLYAIDTVALEVKDSDPPNGTNNVSLDKNITINFNKDVWKAEAFERIRLTDEMVSPVIISRTLTGSTLVLNPDTDLQSNHYYNLTIPADAVKDFIGRNLDENYTLTISTYDVKKEIQAEFTIGQKMYKSAGQIKGMDANPFLENGRSFIPVRYLAMALGVPENGITWDDSTQSVSLKKDNVSVGVSMGSSIININGTASQMDVAPLNRDARIYLPARYIAEAFGFNVDWDQEKQMVYVTVP